MADNKELRGPQDASRIAIGEDYEVEYWSKKFNVSGNELAAAVKAVGDSADAVERHLKSK